MIVIEPEARNGTIPAEGRVMKKFIYIIIFSCLAMMLVVSCSKIRKITDDITQPTAREAYKRDFKGADSLYAAWEQAFQTATLDSLQVAAPYGESGKFRPTNITAYSYLVTLEEGESLSAKVERDSLQQKVFIDIFEVNDSGQTKIISNERDTDFVEYPVAKSGYYKVVVQPEIMANTNFTILLNTAPLYGFPVAGKGNAAIQSFWGYERDGGKRQHEGIDIFAPRGTPVVAVADGIISNIGDRGLGGKQVWQRVGAFGHSIYYAHLDEITAVGGSRVSKGDTVGFVGSTGNAKGGAPHLHFGIYKNFGGAVNPLAFVYTQSKISAASFRSNIKSEVFKIKNAAATLRQGPSTTAPKIGMLQKNDMVRVLGQHKEWLHVRTAMNQKAFVHQSLVSSK